MSTPKKISILNYIEGTILPKIDGEAPYHFTATSDTIFGDEIDYTKLGDGYFPAWFVRDVGTTPFHMYNTSSGIETGEGNGNLKKGWPVIIMAIIKRSSIDYNRSGGMREALIYAQSDIILAMSTEISLGGNCNSAILLDSYKPPIDRDDAFGMVGVAYSIHYDFNPFADSPTT